MSASSNPRPKLAIAAIVVVAIVGLNIPRQSEQGFHGKENTNSTAK
jgi:hypothetical protein